MAAHDGKLARQFLIEIERIHASACDELLGVPVRRRASTREPGLLSHMRALDGAFHSDVASLEAEAIRFTHAIDRVATGTSTLSERDDRLAELDARRDALEREVEARMSTERAALRAERADAIGSLGRLRIVLALMSVFGLAAGILLALVSWTWARPLTRSPIDVIATVQPSAPAKQPELLH